MTLFGTDSVVVPSKCLMSRASSADQYGHLEVKDCEAKNAVSISGLSRIERAVTRTRLQIQLKFNLQGWAFVFPYSGHSTAAEVILYLTFLNTTAAAVVQFGIPAGL